MNFQNIQENAIAEQAKRKAIEDRIDMRKRQIDRLEKKLRKQRAWWGDILIRPIMEAVKEKYPQLSWNDERLVPTGLRCAVSLFGRIGERNPNDFSNTVAMIVFTPGQTEKGEIYFDTGEKAGAYPTNSISELNGFSNVSKKVTSLEEIFNHVEYQIKNFEVKSNKTI